MATQESTKEFEIRQLLKAYRKGLISDALFEEQLRELQGDEKKYMYNGQYFASECEMLIAFLDEYRAAEACGAEALAKWIEVCRIDYLKGGLRVVRQRESSHAQLLAARIQELGGQCRATAPQRLVEYGNVLGSQELTDVQKLQAAVKSFPDPDLAVQPIVKIIDQLQEDLHTKALLRTICDDEIASVKWLQETCTALAPRKTGKSECESA